jgi:hypothetical protein
VGFGPGGYMDIKYKKFIPLFVVIGLALVGAGIYIVVNEVGMATYNTGPGVEPAGFLLGLWQGLIIWLSFISSWGNNTIALYSPFNNGVWYNLGYILGLCITLGGGAKASKNRRKGCCNE